MCITKHQLLTTFFIVQVKKRTLVGSYIPFLPIIHKVFNYSTVKDCDEYSSFLILIKFLVSFGWTVSFFDNDSRKADIGFPSGNSLLGA